MKQHDNADMVEKDDSELRNTIIPLAANRPGVIQKTCIVGGLSLYVMLLISHFSKGALTTLPLVEGLIIVSLLVFGYNLYDYLYRCSVEDSLDDKRAGVMICFSNKLLVLTNDEVITQIEPDEIKIRSVSSDECEKYNPKFTSILECCKEGKVLSTIGVDRLKDFEGSILKADITRIDEDPQLENDDDDFSGDTDEF